MKRFLSLLLICAMLLSLSVTAFAEGENGYTQDSADLQAMATCANSNNMGIELSEQFFVVDFSTNTVNLKFELSTDKGEITGFLCTFIHESLQQALGAAVFPVPSKAKSVITLSVDEPFEMTNAVTSGDNAIYLGYSNRIGFCVIGDVEQETKITLKIYDAVTLTSNSWNLIKTVPFTVQPTTVESTGSIGMEVTCDDRDTTMPGDQVYAGDAVSVSFDVSEDFNGTSAAFSYDASVFELQGDAPDGWTQSDGSYTYSFDSSSGTADLGQFTFLAKEQNADNSEGTFSLSCDGGNASQEKATVIYRTIEYEIENSTDLSLYKQVSLPYNGEYQSLAVKVTEPADGYTIQYTCREISDQSEMEWSEEAPAIKDVSSSMSQEYTYVQITAPGYKTVNDLVLFQISAARVTLTPNDTTIYVGDEVPATFGYTVDGLCGDDQLTTEPTFTTNCTDTSQPGEYTIRAHGASAGNNYLILYRQDGTLTVAKKPSGGQIPPVIGSVLPNLGSQVMSPFVDVTPVDYYFDAVNWAVDNGITTGTGRLSFSPDEACTRAQAVTFLWRAAGSPAPKNAVTPFVDVDSGAYYAKAVAWAVENGITIGTSATTFSPDEPCTRAHIVTFLYRAFGKEAGTAVPFADVAADAYYAPAVAWAAANNITGGTGSGKFSPDSDCTRAQIVTFLYRARAN